MELGRIRLLQTSASAPSHWFRSHRKSPHSHNPDSGAATLQPFSQFSQMKISTFTPATTLLSFPPSYISSSMCKTWKRPRGAARRAWPLCALVWLGRQQWKYLLFFSHSLRGRAAPCSPHPLRQKHQACARDGGWPAPASCRHPGMKIFYDKFTWLMNCIHI